MKLNYIDELSLKMLRHGESWDQELLAILHEMNSLDQQDRDGRTLLINCCAYHFVNSCQYLVQHGANINMQDKKGFSALHVAALRGDLQLVKILLEHGAKTDLQDVFGNNPLFRVKYYNIPLIRLLLDYGCNPYHKNKSGVSAYDILSLHEETRVLLGTGDG